MSRSQPSSDHPPTDVIKFLDADDRLKATDLKKIATELGISVPRDAKTVPQLQTHIARSLIVFGGMSR